jgi:hypothetical protein
MKIRVYTLLINSLFLILLISCSKEQNEQDVPIPYVPVNERININDILYNDLNNVGGWAYLTAGSKGIILYRESLENVSAFERHCTFDPIEVCSQVDMHVSLLQANDNDCCGSVFSISSRSIIKGPASKPLIEYATQFDGTYVIVTN